MKKIYVKPSIEEVKIQLSQMVMTSGGEKGFTTDFGAGVDPDNDGEATGGITINSLRKDYGEIE